MELSARVALSTLQVVHRRARRIVDLPCISSDPAVSVGRRILDELLEGKVVLVDVSGLGGTEEVLVASFLTRRVIEEWQGAFLDDPERHKSLPTLRSHWRKRKECCRRTRTENRMCSRGWRERAGSSGSGLLAVTQQPKLLDDELLSQFNTFFVLGLADEKDRNILRSSAKQDLSALGPEIQTLMPGECLLVNLEAPFAVPAFAYFTKRSFVRRRRRRLLGLWPPRTSQRWWTDGLGDQVGRPGHVVVASPGRPANRAAGCGLPATAAGYRLPAAGYGGPRSLPRRVAQVVPHVVASRENSASRCSSQMPLRFWAKRAGNRD